MKGVNEFRFNTATMIEAMQEYLEAKFVGVAPKVVDVRYEAGSNYTSGNFIVKTEGPKSDPA